MPRVIEKLDKIVEYIPDVDDNRMEEDPMVVEIEPMTVAEVKAYQRRHGPNLQGKKAYSRAQKIMEQAIRDRVHSVKGYVFQGTTIATGDDLAQYGEQDVVSDIFKAIVECSHLLEGLKKKSDSPSDSASPTTQQKTGTAKSASASPERIEREETAPSGSSEIAGATPTQTSRSASIPL